MKDYVEKKEKIDTKTKCINAIKNVLHILDDFIYYCVLFPLLIISVIIVYKSLRYPDKIPDAFGYKMFMILDDYMDDSVEFGDLVFTRNINPEDLNVDNIIAFRNGVNTVTLHKILEKNQETKIDEESGEEKQIIKFTMNTLENETLDTKYVSGDKVEGILVSRIKKIGYIILLIQEPLVMALIIIVIIIVGLIIYYIAQQLDFRDMKKMQELEELKQIEENKKKESKEKKK